MEQKKARLLRLLTEKSFRYSPDAPFRLASGRESPYYVDCRPVTHSAEGLFLIGEIIFDLIKDPRQVENLAGSPEADRYMPALKGMLKNLIATGRP